jgi:hypothetical protein
MWRGRADAAEASHPGGAAWMVRGGAAAGALRLARYCGSSFKGSSVRALTALTGRRPSDWIAC